MQLARDRLRLAPLGMEELQRERPWSAPADTPRTPRRAIGAGGRLLVVGQRIVAARFEQGAPKLVTASGDHEAGLAVGAKLAGLDCLQDCVCLRGLGEVEFLQRILVNAQALVDRLLVNLPQAADVAVPQAACLVQQDVTEFELTPLSLTDPKPPPCGHLLSRWRQAPARACPLSARRTTVLPGTCP